MRLATGELLRHHRTVTVAALAVLAGLAWLWLATGAGIGMPMAMEWTGARAILTLAMWWVMMIAMMVPAAAPVILLHDRAHPTRPGQSPHGTVFLFGYLLAWFGFSVAAVALQWSLERAGLLSAMSMSSASHWLTGAILIGAGLYQLSAWKDACLSHCRTPAHFLAAHYRPGASGALRMGMIHGSYCVGCCWMLMSLLFIGGVMNLAWVAALTILVAAEKLLPRGRWFARASGFLFLVWGGLVLMIR